MPFGLLMFARGLDDDRAGTIPSAGYTSKKVYDADGLVTAEITAIGHMKRTVYDEAGQPIEIRVPHTPIGRVSSG